MTHKCSKRLSALTWALLECMFFSSVVLGWTWLAIVFRSDGYFPESCNVTLLNVTSPGADALTRVDQRLTGLRAGEGYKRVIVTKRPCRPKRPKRNSGNLDLGSLAAEVGVTAQRMTVSINGEEPAASLGNRLGANLSRLTDDKSLRPSGGREEKETPAQSGLVFVSNDEQSPQLSHLVQAFRLTFPRQGTLTGGLPRYKRDLGVSAAEQPLPTAARAARPRVVGYCLEQNEKIRLMFALVLLLRDLLTFPMGAFYDKHGTTKTRLLTVLIFALGTLMMIFTSADVPWLVVPALALTGAAGSAVLLSNLQTANLFGRKRHIVVSMYVGAAYSNGIITFLMQLSHFDGVNLQTSFMFLTIGIVPLLVSTVAFLPKTRIPWPLPADYGKRRNKSLDEDMLRKQRAWQRRMSEDPDLDLAPHLFPDSSPLTEAASGARCRKPPPQFSPLARQSLFVVSCLWFGLQRLQEAVFDTRVVDLADMELAGSLDYETYYGVVQLLAVCVSPLAGLLIDRHMPRELGSTQATQQMRRIIPSIAVTSSLGVVQILIDMYPHPAAQCVAAVVNLLHKVFAHTTMCAFVMHVHFNHQHLGKYYGLTCAVSAVISAFQFPVRIFLIKMASSLMAAHILLLVLGVVSLGHVINVWDQCRRRLIRDQSDRSSERFQNPPPGGVVPLSVYIETDESNLPANNAANTGGNPPAGGKEAEGEGPSAAAAAASRTDRSHGEGDRCSGRRVVVVVDDSDKDGAVAAAEGGQDAANDGDCVTNTARSQALVVEDRNDTEAPPSTTLSAVGEDALAAVAAAHPALEANVVEDEERIAGEDIYDEEDEIEETSPSTMLEFAKL